MKKIIFAIILAAMLMASNLYAAGSCTQKANYNTNDAIIVIFTCTGDASDGSIPDTAINNETIASLKGKYYLYTVTAYPTSGGTAPDAADVFVLDANGEDLLGSADGGTTANKGENLIHATLKKTTIPYSYYLSSYYFPLVNNVSTLRVSSQATASAEYTIELTFVR